VNRPVDVIVPTYNNLPQLQACLRSIESQRGPSLSVIVCVDGSNDGTLEWATQARLAFPCTVAAHRDGRNHGRAAARNLALPHLRGDVTLLLDSDMRLAPDALERHLELLERRRCASVGEVVYENATSNLWARYLGTRGKNKAREGADIRPLDFNTQNTALWTDDLVSVGGFDEEMTGYGGEDTELGLRLAEVRGLNFVFNAAAHALTVEEKTAEEGLEQLRRFAATNLPRIRRLHPDGPAPFWVDRAESNRLADRLFRALLNPVSDRIVEALFPRAPWLIQRQLLNFRVIRAVFDGYLGGAGS
jgi:glycosyltransferase involved in cell wall biosynthesis